MRRSGRMAKKSDKVKKQDKPAKPGVEDLDPASGTAEEVRAGRQWYPDVCKEPTPGGPVPIPYPNRS